MNALVDLARRMVRIPSVTTDGTREVATFLRDEVLAGCDFDELRLEHGADERQVNVVATKALDSMPPILLNSHLDTVPPGDPALWTECDGDPFAAKIVGSRLYGLGSADAKLDALCKALAFRRSSGRRFGRGVIFVATYGEERGLLGARQMLERLPRRPAAAWVGEPTALALVTRHKGFLAARVEARLVSAAPTESEPTTRLVVRGRSAHSSAPHLGENAIVRALELAARRSYPIVSIRGGDALNKVPAACRLEIAGRLSAADVEGLTDVDIESSGAGVRLAATLESFVHAVAAEIRRIGSATEVRDDAFSPPFRTASLGRIEAANGHARLAFDVRSLPGQPTADIRQRLDRIAALAGPGLEVSAVVDRDNPALDSADESPALVWSRAALAALGLPTTPHTKAGCTEAGVYAAAGIPAVVFGPGESMGNIHAPNEHVSLDQLDRAVDFYATLLEEVCLD